MKSASSTVSGILLVDKPAGFTSHDAVARTRRLAGTRKVGHAGTLDPMATGLLVLGINSSTRLLTYVVGLDKEYLATVRLGAATTTDDAEGELIDVPEAASVLPGLTPAQLEGAFAAQQGTIVQVPSSVSAIKVDGKRAYARVRAGEEVQLAGRTVTISELELLGSARITEEDGRSYLDQDIRVVCSSGTYIRAIARDVGTLLGVGGHLTRLRRTRIGPFAVAEASTPEQLADALDADAALPLRSPASVARQLFTVLEVDDAQATALGHGQRIALTDGQRALVEPRGDRARVRSEADTATDATTRPFAAITADERLLGLVELSKGTGKSVVNFPPDDLQHAPDGSASDTRTPEERAAR